ncbi:phage tail tape measure protein, partial [Pseudomonas putida]|uniref:phage tail tape measure protein n=1 Tax=Pseudomonas putida TaxID=303 RepID=UPI00349EAB63
MTNFAQLGIEVNSESAAQAADDLDKLVDSGKSAEDSARRVGAAWEKAVAGISSDTGQIVQELKLLNSRQDSTAQLMAKLAQSVTDASKAFTTASVGAQTMAAAEAKVGESAEQAKSRLLALATATVDSAKSQEVMSRAYEATAGSAAAAMRAQLDQAAAQSRSARVAATAAAEQEQLAAAERKATGATSDQARELEKLLGAIDPTIAAFARLEKQQEDLAKFRKSGLLPEDDFNEYSAKLDAARSSLGGFSDGLGKAGVSAKQTAAAMRMLPAQFSDIFISLQGGQAPLTVFLQQGSQIKDSFGGIGAAASALGEYVVGLVNPFTLAAAAVGTLAAAMVASQSQFNDYNRAVLGSGSAIGFAADKLGSLATTLAGGRYFSEANEAVLSLAQSGRVTGETFEEVARAATQLSAATGKSASDFADQLSSAKGGVAELALEYSNKYGVITQSTMDQIRALEDQGDRMGAIKALAGSVADEMTQRNQEMVESTRGLVAVWNDVRSSVASVFNEVKNRLQASPELFRLQVLQGLLEDAKEIGDKKLVSYYEQQISAAQKAVDLQEQKAASAGQEEQSRRNQIAEEYRWAADGKKFLTDQQKMESEIADAKARGLSAGKSEAEIEQRIQNIRKSYEKADRKSAPAVNLSTFNEAENALKSLVSNYKNSMRVLDASLKAGVITQQDYTQQKSALIDKERTDVEEGYKSQITALQALADKSSTTGAQRIQIDQRIADTRQKMTQALQKLDADQQVLSLQSQERLAKETAAIEAYGQALEDNLKRTQDSLDLQLAGFGLGERSRQQLQEMLKIRQDYEKDLEKLERDHRLKRISDNEYAGEKKELEKWLSERLKLQEQYYADEDALRGDWQNGVSRAYNSYIEETKDIAGQTENLFSNALGGIEDAFVNLATEGKLSFKDLTDSIIADLARMATKAYITVPLLGALGLGGSTPGGGGSILGGGGDGGGGLASLWDIGTKAYGVATSGFGSAVSAGWSAGEGFLGGMQSAISGGYNYLSSGLSSLFSSGSAA